LFGGGADDVVYPGATLAVTTIDPPLTIEEQRPEFQDITIEYEIYAENLVSIKSQVTITAVELAQQFSALVPTL
jgi:hypothetical protein